MSLSNPFELLINALDHNEAHPIRQFGEYYLTDRVKKHSQQGLVVFGRNKVDKLFAIKFYRPTDEDPSILKKGRQRFINEVRILVTLNHKNIVNVYTGGSATWNEEKENEWSRTEGFRDDDPENKERILYYVMDFIQGQDISSMFPGLRPAYNPNTQTLTQGDRVRLFEDMIHQVSSAMAFYHSQHVTHKDIKPDNIRYSEIDATFIVVDFGFAHHFESKPDPNTFPRTEYMDIESILEDRYDLNDLGQFSRVLIRILDSLKDSYDTNRYDGMKSALERAKAPSLNKRYKSASEFLAAVTQYFICLPQWKLELRLNETLCSDGFGKFIKKLRIPYSGSIPIVDEVELIIDTPEFQRLRGVRQLGPLIFVFPGATHTRYEHSLGTYHLALKYLEVLLNWPGFREACHPVDDAIKLTVLSALLHDIGHYPYSHWIEEVEQFQDGSGGPIAFPSHEARARQIIKSGELCQLIEHRWNVDPNTVADIIAREHVRKPQHLLINSLIDSPLDVDKLDYLVRDSIHCGVDYGRGIDVNRFLDSLCVARDSKTLCLTDKGMSCLLSLLTCRNIMYQEVYWHKTVRACVAMFKRFFYEYVKSGIDEVGTVQGYFELADDQFAAMLVDKCANSEHRKLAKLANTFAYRGRKLYKPAYIFYAGHGAEQRESDIENFFADVIDNPPYQRLVDVSDQVAIQLKKHIPAIEPLDVLIESTPVRKRREEWQIKSISIWDIRKGTLGRYPAELNHLDSFLRTNARAYLFCNPMYYKELKELTKTPQFAEVLAECRL